MTKEKDIEDLQFVCLRCTLPACNEGDPDCLYNKALVEAGRKSTVKIAKSGTKRGIPFTPGTNEYMREYLKIRRLEKNGGIRRSRGRPKQVEKI